MACTQAFSEVMSSFTNSACGQASRFSCRPEERLSRMRDLRAQGEKSLRDVRSDKAGAAGYECLHGGCQIYRDARRVISFCAAM